MKPRIGELMLKPDEDVEVIAGIATEIKQLIRDGVFWGLKVKLSNGAVLRIRVSESLLRQNKVVVDASISYSH